MKFFFKRDDLNSAIGQLQAGLDKLNLTENFQGFEWKGTIPPNTEIQINNGMLERRIPTSYLLTMAEGTNLIVKGPSGWTKDILAMKNLDPVTSAKVTIYFFR